VSEAALKALEGRAKGAEPAQASARSQALADLSSRAAGKPAPEPAKPRKGFAMPSGRMPTSRMPDVDPRRAEAALQMGTGTAGAIVGGLTGASSLLAGADPNVAADRVKWWQQALTYQPRSEVGQETAESIGAVLEHPANPVTWPGLYGETLAGHGEALGLPPSVLSILRVAPDAATAILGAPGKVPAAARASLIEDVQGAGAAIPRAMERIADVREPELPPDANPFARESLGAAAAVPSQLKTASPELQAAVRAEAREGGVNREALDRHLEADTLPIPMRLTKGQATQDPVQISEEMNRRAKGDAQLVRIFNEQNQQLVDNLDEIRRETSPNVVGNDHIQNGQQLIDSYKAYDEAARAEINAAYQAARDANGGDLPMDAQSFTKAADASLKRNMKARYLPSEIAADLAEIRETGAMNFETFENLRTNLAAEARKADRSGDGNAAAAISLVREALENVEPLGRAAEVKPLFDTARSLAKARFDRLKADPAYKAAAEDDVSMGEASALADDFIHKYVIKGKSANLDRMRETLAADPVAPEVISAGALNYLKSKSGVNLYTNEGNFSQAGFNRALSEVSPKLESLVGPQHAEQVRTLGNVARYTMHQPRGHYVANSNTPLALAKEKALSVAETAFNTAVLPGAGLGTKGRVFLERQAEKKFVKEATKPGAGLKLNELLKEKGE
jgi:hypothetical protein